MGKRKIIFSVINDLSTDRRMQRVCSSLQSNGYDVVLVGRVLYCSEPVHFQFISKRLKCFFNKGKLFYLEYNIRLFFFLLFNKASIYAAVDLDTILPNLLVSKFRRKPCVYDAHEYFSEVPEVVNRKLTKAIWEKIASFSIPKMKRCYTVSNALASEFQNRYKVPFHVIKNCPPLETETQPILQPDVPQPYVLYQGALNEARGLEELINSAKYLNCHVVIAGTGDLDDSLKQLAEMLGVQEKVTFIGKFSKNGILPYTKHAFVSYTLLLNKGRSYYNSLANKFFDSVMAETPVLMPPFPAYKALNKEFEVGVEVECTSKSIVFTVNELLENRSKHKLFVENCKKAKQHWNWQVEERKLLDLINSI
ncbi:MAG: glycosyltransferase [Bacteroidetes bacterium]|nr:glycosyltransferase [Bacteroidota bacterium]